MKHARPGNWLAGRLSKPIDRLWLGGMAAVNVSVWAVFGAKYIGLALIAYCFIFVLALRRQIKAAYPAVADAEYRFGYPCNLPWLTNGDPDKIFLHVLWIFPVYMVVATVLSALFSSVSVLSVCLVFLACNGAFLRQHQALFTVCCGGGQLKEEFQTQWQKLLGKRRNDAFSLVRLTITTMVFALAWGGVLTAYVTGQMGGEHFFGIAEYGTSRLYAAGLSLVIPVILHIVLLEILTTALRGWGEEPSAS